MRGLVRTYSSHQAAMPAEPRERPPRALFILVNQHTTLRVLRTNRAAECVLIAAIPATWRVPAAEDASVLAEAWLSRLQLSSLFNTGLPKVVTSIAEMCGAETKVMSLPLAAIAAFPSKELHSVLWALQLALGSAAPTYEFHSQSSLHVIIQVILLVLHSATTLHLTPIVRLVALATLKEHHLGHGQLGDPVLFAWVARSKCGPPVLHNPTLQCFSSDLLIHRVLRSYQLVQGRVLYDRLTQGAAYAFKC